MTRNTLFGRFDSLFRQGITESTSDGRDGSREVRLLNLSSGNSLRCSMDEEAAYWYEVVFGDGETPAIRIMRTTVLSPGNTEIMEAVLNENGA